MRPSNGQPLSLGLHIKPKTEGILRRLVASNKEGNGWVVARSPCLPLGWARKAGSQPSQSVFLCSLLRPQLLVGEEGRHSSGRFVFIFEWFPAPSPKLFSLTVSRQFLSYKEGSQGPFAPVSRGARAQLSSGDPKMRKRKEKLRAVPSPCRGNPGKRGTVGCGWGGASSWPHSLDP